jgi:hypothetical protein
LKYGVHLVQVAQALVPLVQQKVVAVAVPEAIAEHLSVSVLVKLWHTQSELPVLLLTVQELHQRFHQALFQSQQ